MRSLEQRVTRLESDVLQQQHDRLDDQQAARATADHLTMAVGDLSQGQRAMALDIREIHGRLDLLSDDVTGLKTDITGLKTDVGELKTDVGGLNARMANVEGLLQQILSRLPANGPSET